MKAVIEALRAAKSTLDADDELGALDALLVGWRASKAPELADAIEALSARFAPHLPAPTGTLDAFQVEWLALARRGRAADVPRLLESVLHQTKRFGVAVVEALTARGVVVEHLSADPRASAILARHLADGGYESKSKSTLPFWSSVMRAVISQGDRRIVSKLCKVKYANIYRHFSDAAKRIVWFQTHLDAVVVELGALEPPQALSGDLKRQLAQFITSVSKRPVSAATSAMLTERVVLPPAPAKPKRPERRSNGSAEAFLSSAASALAGGDDSGALNALLEAWRAVPSSSIAGAIETVSARVDLRLPRINGKNRAAIQAMWLTVNQSNDAADVPRLLSTVTHTLLRSTDALARVQAFAERPRDSRTTDLLIGQLQRMPFSTSSSRPFWSALISLIADHADPRAPQKLEAIGKRFATILKSQYTDVSSTVTWFRNQVTTAAAAIQTREPVLSAPQQQVFARVLEHLDGPDARFLARIAASPNDVKLKQLFADHLQERADPRGEFIALQIAGRDDARAQTLRAAHAHGWVGPLLPLIELDQCTFTDGFLHEVVLTKPTNELVGDPIWATVSRVTVAGSKRNRIEQFKR